MMKVGKAEEGGSLDFKSLENDRRKNSREEKQRNSAVKKDKVTATEKLSGLWKGQSSGSGETVMKKLQGQCNVCPAEVTGQPEVLCWRNAVLTRYFVFRPRPQTIITCHKTNNHNQITRWSLCSISGQLAGWRMRGEGKGRKGGRGRCLRDNISRRACSHCARWSVRDLFTATEASVSVAVNRCPNKKTGNTKINTALTVHSTVQEQTLIAYTWLNYFI